MKPRMAITAIPPITPPTIAPTGVGLLRVGSGRVVIVPVGSCPGISPDTIRSVGIEVTVTVAVASSMIDEDPAKESEPVVERSVAL